MKERSAIFWDFDGVIKDSLEVKADAFERLFTPFGAEVGARVRQHHEQNGGMSRYEKLPLYLKWAQEPSTAENITHYSNLFSGLVKQAVIDSAWVPGALEYLLANSERQYFVLITATPQEEINQILQALNIFNCFREVHGAPMPKTMAVADVLSRLRCRPEEAIVIGDSQAELSAAKENGLQLVLRRTPFNVELQQRYCGPQCEDFTNG